MIRLILSMILGLLISTVLSVAIGVNPLIGAPIGLVLMALPRPQGAFHSGINPEIWQSFIAENLFRGMEFIRNAYNADQYVIGGRIVHIPQAGSGITAKRNRVNLPAQIVRRSDTDITYALDEFTTDPMLIVNAENVELSYDKLSSVLGEHIQLLRQLIGDWIAYKWSPAANIIRTTGDAVAAHLTSATGNRRLIRINDIRAAKLELNKQLIPQEGRYVLISPNMLDQLVSSLSTFEFSYFKDNYDTTRGVIGRIEGFDIIERPVTARYTNASTPVKRDPEAAAAATDNDSALVWQTNAVEKAEGSIEMFEDIGDPTMYGDIYSALVRLGGRIRRNDEKGVIAIAQASV